MQKEPGLRPTGTLNVTIAIASYGLAVALLVFASRAESWWSAFAIAVIFSFVGNTVFSLLHESVHRSFSENRTINNLFGRISAAFFPTGFALQRGFHLGHHRRNRTDAEMFDMYYETDNRFLKYFQWYSIFTGLYWLSTPIAAFMYLVWPGFFRLGIWKKNNQFGYQTGAEAMFSSVERETSPWIARGEVLFSCLFQAGLFWLLGLQWQRWLLCYWLFGMNWGALQYADHAWSPRDIRHGAWNLQVPNLVRLVFLNYHLHQAHHINPTVPWFHLPRFVEEKSPRPTFMSIYWKMWMGPTPAIEKNPQELDAAFVLEMES